MNCSDETQSTIHLCDLTDRGVNYSVTIQEINVIFSTFKSFMLTVSMPVIITTIWRPSHDWKALKTRFQAHACDPYDLYGLYFEGNEYPKRVIKGQKKIKIRSYEPRGKTILTSN